MQPHQDPRMSRRLILETLRQQQQQPNKFEPKFYYFSFSSNPIDLTKVNLARRNRGGKTVKVEKGPERNAIVKAK